MYRSQGNIWLRVEILSSFQSCYLEFLYISKKKFSIPFILIGSLMSLIIFCISHWGYFNLQKFSSILTLHLLSDQNGIRGGKCHTLRSKTLEIKILSTLTGILLIRGTMGYHFFFFLSLFSGWYRGTPNSTAGHLYIFFLRGCRALAPFYFLEISLFLHSPCL